MPTEELKLIVDLLNSMSDNAFSAFVIWLIADWVQNITTGVCLFVLGWGIFKGIKGIMQRATELDKLEIWNNAYNYDNSKLLRILEEGRKIVDATEDK